MSNTPFETNQPSQMQALEGYEIRPLFTVGETIDGYVPPGILDGAGAYKLDDTTVRIFVNHEISVASGGYAYTLESGVELRGARVSYFDLDIQTLQIVDSGLAYDTIYNRAGEMVTAETPLDTIYGGEQGIAEFGSQGLDRFCSANLFEAGQYGFVDTIFFTGEETDDGTEFALDAANNELWALPWLGVAAWESVTALETGTEDKIALLVGDDRGPAPGILYVGTKGVDVDGDGEINFLERNGLTGGDLFVWVADDPNVADDAIEADARDFAGTGNSTAGRFVEIEIYDEALAGTLEDLNGDGVANELAYDALGFATQIKQDALAAEVGAFLFSRPEDVATDPFDGTRAVLASTGRQGLFDDADVWGTTYIFDFDFSGVNEKTINAEVEILFDGNDFETNGLPHPDFGLRSPDNLDWADDGLIYLQEDRAISSSLFGATSGEEASIWTIDPSAEAPETTLTRVAQIDRSGVPSDQTDPVPNDIGNWESSGIVDISNLVGTAPGSVFVFDVQAHSLRDGNIINVPGVDTNGDGTVTRQDNLVEGGQLSLLIAPGTELVQDSALVSGTPDGDLLVGGFDFSAVNDIVFTGAGADEIDVPFAGVLAGNNRIFSGSGDDILIVGNKDRANGGSGADEFDASDAMGYRISGNSGDDVFLLGQGGRVLGGDGDDQFYVGEGSDNLLSGGAGADQFWLLTDEIPAQPNTVVDFTQGVDVIGILGQGAGVGFANLAFDGNDIKFNGDVFATLSGFNTAALTSADFVFM
ncbi:MAG: hypothetical protein GC158_09465 [Cyanobacteria bacterium RI_101]|nr:hypothetical protein [Cyanobacteria bacterium RI_101]